MFLTEGKAPFEFVQVCYCVTANFQMEAYSDA